MTGEFSPLEHGSRTFDDGDQEWFAESSGDFNPLHVDPLAARRSLYGRTLVHGVHVALWAIERWCASSGRTPGRVAVTFAKPVFVGEKVKVVVGRSDGESSQLRVVIGDVVLITIRLRDGAAGARSVPGGTAHQSLRGEPADLDIEAMHGRTGTVVPCSASGTWGAAFPALAAMIGEGAIAELAALSTIVGMECPGLHSVFGGFDVRLQGGDGAMARVAYEVTRADSGLSAVRLSVRGSHLEGYVTALVRPRPRIQPSAAEVAAMVGADEFEDMRAVVVGGSRGLGEVTAKIVAAGGGHVLLTWQRGQSDAEAVARDIRSTGGSVDVIELDVARPRFSMEAVGDATHLFYFASPRITARRLSSFEWAVFERFVEVYGSGFCRVADAVVRAGAHDLRSFYPSTVYIDDVETGLVEYAAAKAAGEVMAEAWSASRSSTSLVIERLPRLATDQTATIVPVEAADTLSTMLEVVRRVRDSEPSNSTSS